MEIPVGERFARAVAAKDTQTLLGLLDPQIDFRAMTPGRFWEESSASAVVDDVIFGHWFEPTDQIEAIEGIEHGMVVDRHRVGYRFRVTNANGTYTVEQRAYFGVHDDRISWLRIMCSGYRPVEQPTA
ncbi:MAG: hypothetical protein M3Q30_21425 [Actinomycetota bacterium]|nr:hypothetical protein [Actinomycetota bacterium]